MIKTYKLKLEANQVKKDKILELIKVYRETAKLVLNEQMKLFYTISKLNKNHKLNINTKLSARYLQTLQYQVVSMLNSYLSNRQNEFKDIVTNSTLNEKTKTQLYYINKYQKWFSDEVTMQKKKIDNTILKLARAIDYLFVAKDYRKKIIAKNYKASQILISFILDKIIPTIQEVAMIRYLALYPDMQNEKLANYYLNLIPQSFKIKENKDIWILFKL